MSHRISMPRAAVSALLACALLATLLPSMADAAVPRTGYYSGQTSQTIASTDPAEQPKSGSVNFKVFTYGTSDGPVRKIFKVSATTQLQCASGEVKEDLYVAYVILGGKIDRLGRFKYSYNGFTIKGRFTTGTSAKGTLSHRVGDCKAENVNWSAKRSTGGLPVA
ncbi:MAG TPA: hypothetical protein VKA57_05550 [Solirubrobacteraceae bacterium]|nr:hypothetical protein [Solirubrobacteraceae bacterium]